MKKIQSGTNLITIRRENGDVFIGETKLSAGHEHYINIPNFVGKSDLILKCSGYEVTAFCSINGQNVFPPVYHSGASLRPSLSSDEIGKELECLEKGIDDIKEAAKKISLRDVWVINY